MKPSLQDNTPPAAQTSAAPCSPRVWRLLLAEDDNEMRTLLGAVLRRDGLEVVEACNGTEAWLKVSESLVPGAPQAPLDLVLMDVRMPGMTGLRVLEIMRAQRCWTPVILISAFCDPETRAQAVGLGAAAVLDKPFDLKSLRQAISASCWPGGRPEDTQNPTQNPR